MQKDVLGMIEAHRARDNNPPAVWNLQESLQLPSGANGQTCCEEGDVCAICLDSQSAATRHKC